MRFGLFLWVVMAGALVAGAAGAGETAPPTGTGDLAPPTGAGDLRPPTGTGDLRPPTGTGDLAPPIGSGDLRPPIGTGDLAPPTGSGDLRPPTGSGDLVPPTGTGELVPPTGTGEMVPTADAGETATLAGAEEKAPVAGVGAKVPFAGTWRLLSWTMMTNTGETVAPFGDTPEGQLIYTADGYVSAQLSQPTAILSFGEPMISDEVLAEIYGKFYLAYFGDYSVDEVAGTVTHHVEGSLVPLWPGKDLVRHYRLLDDGRLELRADAGDDDGAVAGGLGGNSVSLWERVE